MYGIAITPSTLTPATPRKFESRTLKCCVNMMSTKKHLALHSAIEMQEKKKKKKS